MGDGVPYFFAACGVTPVQDPAPRSGSVSATSCGLTSSFTSSIGGDGLRAFYAVCRGAVVIQEVDHRPDLVNLALKPERQPNPYCTPVELFAYRDLKEQHFHRQHERGHRRRRLCLPKNLSGS